MSRTKIIARPNEPPPPAGAGGLAAGRREKAGDREERQAADQQYLHHLLQRLRLHRADDVERRQRRDAERGPNCGALPAEREDLRGVVAESERHRRDGAGLDHRHARPGEQERGAASRARARGTRIRRRSRDGARRAPHRPARRTATPRRPAARRAGTRPPLAVLPATSAGSLKMPTPIPCRREEMPSGTDSSVCGAPFTAVCAALPG